MDEPDEAVEDVAESPVLVDAEGAALLIREEGGAWHQPAVRSYQDEAHLEEMLATQPSLLPGVAVDAAAVRQLYVPDTGPTDVICVDGRGAITLCECKLAANPEMRRTVVGQVFAYASGMSEMSFQQFDAAWQARTGGVSLVTSVVPDADAAAADVFRSTVRDNLADGRFNLVLAVDALTPELRRIVQFLNSHMSSTSTVVAFELGYGREGSVEVLLPRVYGAELAASKTRKASSARKWTEGDLVDHLLEVAPDAVEALVGLLDRYRSRVAHYYTGEGRFPAATAVVSAPVRCHPFSIYTDQTWVGVAPNFEWMNRAGDAVREAVLEHMERDDTLRRSLAGIREAGFKKRPTLRWAGCLDTPGAFDQLVAGFDLLFEGLRPEDGDAVPV